MQTEILQTVSDAAQFLLIIGFTVPIVAAMLAHGIKALFVRLMQ